MRSVNKALFYLKAYSWNVLVALDQLGNTLLAGYPDTTISSRAYHNKNKWPWGFIDRILGKIDENHGSKVYEEDENNGSIFDKKYNPH